MTEQPGAALEDVLRVQRNQAYERSAQGEAEYYATPRMLEMDVHEPIADAYLNERFTGDRNVPWYEIIPNYGCFTRGCVLGAGGTKQRSRILEQNPQLSLKIYDISKESLEGTVADLSSRFPGRVETEVVDLNFVEFKESSFDLVISSSCVHHLTNLEHVAFQINRCLTPEGYLFLQDYVGEAKFQFSPEKTQRFEQAFADVRRKQRALRHWRVVWPGLEPWDYSPFEAIRSNEILDVFGSYLSEVDVRTAGAIVGLVGFTRGPAPLGKSTSIWESAKRRVGSLKSAILSDRMSSAQVRSFLIEELLPMDREVSDDGSLRPANAFAIYRKRATR